MINKAIAATLALFNRNDNIRKVVMGFLLGAILFSAYSINAEGNSLGLIYKDTEVPDEIYSSAILCGMDYNICPELLMSIAYYESRYNPDVKNGNCIGLMQVNVKSHKHRLKAHGFTEEDMYDEYKNMIIAAEILEDLFNEHEDVGAVLCAYNGDAKGLKTYLECGKLPKYATKVLEKSAELEEIHGKHDYYEEETWQ